MMRDNSHYLKIIDSSCVERRTTLPRLSAHYACNPSIVYTDGKFLAVYKGINFNLKLDGYLAKYAGVYFEYSDSQNYFALLDKDLKILSAGFVEDRHIRSDPRAWQGIQDLRLFYYGGKMRCMGAAITHETDPKTLAEIRVERMILCELNGHCLENAFYLPSRQRREKNWMPWVAKGDLYCIYKQDPFEVLQIKDGKIEKSILPNGHPGLIGQSGGSGVIPWNDKFISIIHQRFEGEVIEPVEGKGKTIRSLAKGALRKILPARLQKFLPKTPIDRLCYTHSVVVYSQNFDVLFVSNPFTFEGQRVEFCTGIQYVDGAFVISYGVWDQEAVLLQVEASSFLEAVGLGSLN